MAETMKAWRFAALNGTLEDSLTLENNLPIPDASTLSAQQVIVKVISAALNPVDYKPLEAGLIGRLIVPRPSTPGIDFCGRVIATHASETTLEAGQLVFGGFSSPSERMGTLGAYIVISTNCCAPLPEGIPPDYGAAAGTAATSAYQSLLPAATAHESLFSKTFKPGTKVFIDGGSGGVGTWTIQFAKAMGAQVVTTCSGANAELCRQLGADEVIDYRTEDVIANLKDRGAVFDLVIDNVAKTSALYDNRHRLLSKTGTFVQVGVGNRLSIATLISMVLRQIRGAVWDTRKFHIVNMKNSTEFLTRVGGWMASGEARAVIDSTYSFKDVPAAYRKLRAGHARGKIIVHVSEEEE